MKKNRSERNYYYWLLLIFSFALISQWPSSLLAQDDPYEMKHYPFIRDSLNRLEIYGNQEAYNLLFQKLTDIGMKGRDKVRIVHIGDSHLQADFFSGAFRKRLQTFFLGAMGGRGFIFPYKVAETNNPLNYSVASTGQWEHCRNVEKERSCPLGLSGISVKTADPGATITISISDPNLPGYDFDKLMVFHRFDKAEMQVGVAQREKLKRIQDFPEKGYTLFEFTGNLEKVTLKLKQTAPEQKEFTLYGLNFDSNDSGIIYHTIGVNGAKFESYVSCEYFIPHLEALQPDWVIVSLGTNDCYTNVFNAGDFSKQVDSLLHNIQQAAPNAAILLTTPGDHRIKKGPVNENVALAGSILKQKAKEYNISSWDFYSVMGGSGSIDGWRHFGLAHTDYLHYTQAGYDYQAQLFFVAFLKAYDKYITQELLEQQ